MASSEESCKTLASRQPDDQRAQVEMAHEIRRLNFLVDALRQREHSARQDSRMLKEIVDQLPISLTVQEDNGLFILVNAVAAAHLTMQVVALIGASPIL